MCSVRTTTKKDRILVGDSVDIIPNDYDKGKYIITNVNKRKNSVPRPPVANIDKLLIVIASRPEPDLFLVDKLIVYCYLKSIEPVIVINKSDIATNDFIEDICKQYYFLKTFVISSHSGQGVQQLKEYISNSISSVCGQSAVGKSSLLNVIIPNINLETQGLSRKIDRGKYTTRVNELFVDGEIMLVDTTGFSSLSLDIDYDELASFYPEFDDYMGVCRYLDCSHVKEGKDCAIVNAVADGKINSKRYDRYKYLYNQLFEKWEKKYD